MVKKKVSKKQLKIKKADLERKLAQLEKDSRRMADESMDLYDTREELTREWSDIDSRIDLLRELLEIED